MSLYPAVAGALAALLVCSPAVGQGVLRGAAPVSPESVWQPEPERSSAWQLALWGVAPYAEFEAAGMPLPPSPAEVKALPFLRRMQEQVALKKVWLECLIRATEERHRISRENLSQAALMARQLGAPAGFVDSLRRQASGNLSPRERYMQELYRQSVFSAYGVNAVELRFFVESCELPAEKMREVVDWLPLPALFNVRYAASADAAEARFRLRTDYVAFLAVCRDVAQLLRPVNDRASADAAAEAMLPVLLRALTTQDSLLAAPAALRQSVLAPYARLSAPVNEAYTSERTRLTEQHWYGSARLQVLDYLLPFWSR